MISLVKQYIQTILNPLFFLGNVVVCPNAFTYTTHPNGVVYSKESESEEEEDDHCCGGGACGGECECECKK
ncbi:MAG TPA: hypothetical protein DCY48_03230 [Candidatus Magasanikbacteria bacterium]|nr:MAG: hypothetical protein A3I74_04325 [Candidatus Magasanikbacteria bacterium RIFCSPLOWO2_02_FULL_47_16]OGH79381.1 MAG: hypothetical protein A3C10_04860 [Candidatus Magasanikbacteria bacterium RIFCSPHIGHO2_02_FULL_48_18]OGH82501.1 MAG: hypothetical protein A3G08_00785 [Candidatus Magasanikbacteria bacterium RIFCSPLOWO2_12_FULL_47_9b]HAZ28758.1 hypothetical protein [Candidatus Magasanikbacteria bacterium]